VFEAEHWQGLVLQRGLADDDGCIGIKEFSSLLYGCLLKFHVGIHLIL
jgi:hypothetical protein